MAAGKSGGSSGEITFLEGTSMSAFAGGWGVGMKIQENVLPSSPDIRLFTLGRFGGGGGVGGRGLPGRWWGGSALGSSPSVLGAWPGAGKAEKVGVHRAAGRSWWVAFEGARLSLTFKEKKLVVA